jgi:hypothetical protein
MSTKKFKPLGTAMAALQQFGLFTKTATNLLAFFTENARSRDWIHFKTSRGIVKMDCAMKLVLQLGTEELQTHGIQAGRGSLIKLAMRQRVSDR